MAQPGVVVHSPFAALKELNIIVAEITFYHLLLKTILNPFRAEKQQVTLSPGFTGGYSSSATSWLEKQEGYIRFIN
jgi:hypothetical protein